MINRVIVTIIVLAWLTAWAMPMTAVRHDDSPATDTVRHNGYRTDLLQAMAGKTAITALLDTLPDGEYQALTAYRGKDITAIVSDGRVTHIGYTIFSTEQRVGIGQSVCNFIERYTLQLDLPDEKGIGAESRMRIDRVKMERCGDASELRQLCADSTVMINLQTVGEKGYVMGWRRAEKWLCNVLFPIEYDLLMGTDMDERERRLPEELALFQPLDADTLSVDEENDLKKAWQDNYYTLKGSSYILDNLSSNRYYQKDSTGLFVPIFSRVFPIESLGNLFTTNMIEGDFTIDIRLRKYGFKTDTLSVPLNTWISYCRQTGCQPYFGIISLGDSVATCELVMHNAEMGYNHIMNLSVPLALIDERQGHITARLNSYVTASRVKSLFDDNNQTKKKK